MPVWLPRTEELVWKKYLEDKEEDNEEKTRKNRKET